MRYRQTIMIIAAIVALSASGIATAAPIVTATPELTQLAPGDEQTVTYVVTQPAAETTTACNVSAKLAWPDASWLWVSCVSPRLIVAGNCTMTYRTEAGVVQTAVSARTVYTRVTGQSAAQSGPGVPGTQTIQVGDLKPGDSATVVLTLRAK